jgi:hypothetical protein
MLFVDICNDFSFKQVNFNASTVSGNILDLVLTNFDSIKSVNVCECDFSSDHQVINFNITCKIVRIKAERRVVYNYKNADVDRIKSKLNEANLCELVNNSCNVNDAWSQWLQTVHDIIDDCVPKITLNDSHKVPWFDSEIRHLRKKKRTVWRKCQKDKKASSWKKFRCLRNKLGHLLKKSITNL